jgi:hypothetical protein
MCTGAIAMVLEASACDDEISARPTGPVSLVRGDLWQRVAESRGDIFDAERPDDTACDEQLGLRLEPLGDELVLEVNTDYCNHATLRQPSLVGVMPGDTIKLRIWHSPLVGPIKSEAYLALGMDREILWETRIPIPADAAFVTDEIIVEREWPQGTEVQIHVANHGANTYDLLGIEAHLGGAR